MALGHDAGIVLMAAIGCFYAVVCVCSEIYADKKVELEDVTLNPLCIGILFSFSKTCQ